MFKILLVHIRGLDLVSAGRCFLFATLRVRTRAPALRYNENGALGTAARGSFVPSSSGMRS